MKKTTTGQMSWRAAMTTCRSGRHLIRDSRDRRPNGGCAGCAQQNEGKYRRTLRDARQRLEAISAHIDEIQLLQDQLKLQRDQLEFEAMSPGILVDPALKESLRKIEEAGRGFAEPHVEDPLDD